MSTPYWLLAIPYVGEVYSLLAIPYSGNVYSLLAISYLGNVYSLVAAGYSILRWCLFPIGYWLFPTDMLCCAGLGGAVLCYYVHFVILLSSDLSVDCC